MSCLICLLKEILEVLECTVAQAVEKMNPDERDELKVSGKKAIKKSGCTKRFHVLFTTGCSYIFFPSCFVTAKSRGISTHCHI